MIISTYLPDEYRSLMKLDDNKVFVDTLPKGDVERVCFGKTISKKTVSQGATPQTQDHDGGSALELEEHSQDGRSAPRVTDTYTKRQGPLADQKTMGESVSSTRSDVKLEELNTTSRPAENLRSESKLEEPSKLIFQRQVLDMAEPKEGTDIFKHMAEPNSVAHMDKAKVKGAMHEGYVSTQDHQRQDENEEGTDNFKHMAEPNSVAHMDKAKVKVAMHEGYVGIHDHQLQDENKEGTNIFKHMAPTLSCSAPKEAMVDTKATDSIEGKPWQISTYMAHEESYDDKAAPCA
jgi:hypothetical protein